MSVLDGIDPIAVRFIAKPNESFARVYLAGDAVGQRFRMSYEGAPWLTVIGVVPDMYMDMFGSGGDPAGFYTPMAQSQVGWQVAMAIRKRG